MPYDNNKVIALVTIFNTIYLIPYIVDDVYFSNKTMFDRYSPIDY